MPSASRRELHHYMFIATDHGCYEVLAGGFSTAGARVLPPEDDDDPI
jgi:hypothetical protein